MIFHISSQCLSEGILSVFGDYLENEHKKLAKELQALMNGDLTEYEKELLLQRILEEKLLIRIIRKQYSKYIKHVVDGFYKFSWISRIYFADRSDGSPDISLKMIATPPTDYRSNPRQWGGVMNAFAG